MRIIDKNTDFYDYYQNIYKDNTFTFDRRDSFILTKEMVCDNLYSSPSWSWRAKKYIYNNQAYALLQVCNTFWLLSIEITKRDKSNNVKDYNMKVLAKWKNFNKPRVLCSFETIGFYYYSLFAAKDDLTDKVNHFIQEIDTNHYQHRKTLDIYRGYQNNVKFEKTIPILKACGVATCVDAHDLYLAFEEYFSLEKSASERREPIGTTDIDKIESHGFDKKVSFRGKTKG